LAVKEEAVTKTSGPREPGAQPEQKKKHESEETLLEFVSSIAAVLVVGLFVITFVLQAFEIPSSSMQNTLLIGDHVFGDRVSLAPPAHWMPLVHYREVKRGDIIVFLKPGEPDLFLVKRVMGVPGDHIHLKDDVVYRNGEALKEPYAIQPSDGPLESAYNPYRDEFPATPPDQSGNVTASWSVELPTHIQNGDLVVPPGEYFAMGDNRGVSLDSRFWGFVPRANIVGRPLFVYWSFETPADQFDKKSIGDRIGFVLHQLIHFFDQTRWRRTLHLVR
jgi:signal peptidase I